MQNRILEIATDNVYLSAERGFLKVTRCGEKLGQVAMDDIAGLIVRGYGVSFSTNICARLAKRNAPVIICGNNQSPSSVIWPIESRYQQGFHMQSQAVANKPLLKRLWTELVKSKITHQAAVLSVNLRDACDLKELVKRVKAGDSENIEAQAARRYWSRLKGNNFTRDREQDGVNAALNYGYTVLRAPMSRPILAKNGCFSLDFQGKTY